MVGNCLGGNHLEEEWFGKDVSMELSREGVGEGVIHHSFMWNMTPKRS